MHFETSSFLTHACRVSKSHIHRLTIGCCGGPAPWYTNCQVLSCPCRSLHMVPLMYFNVSIAFICVPLIETVGADMVVPGPGWWRTSALLTLIVRSNIFNVSVHLLSMSCRSLPLHAIKAQSSEKVHPESVVPVLLSLQQGGREKTVDHLASTSGRPHCPGLLQCSTRHRLKTRLKGAGARRQPCFTPSEMLNGTENAPSESTSPVVLSWNR